MEHRLMVTLSIGDKQVAVDDGFHDLPPEDQQATLAEIAAHLRQANGADPQPLARAPASLSVALARDRQPVDFAIHGGPPIAPFSLAGPKPLPPLELRARAGISPG
jgi:hypothetical protein